MNKEFLIKIVEAKQLEYKAIKEILPESIRKRLDDFEKDAISLLKDVATQLIQDNVQQTKSEVVKNIKKVKVDFS